MKCAGRYCKNEVDPLLKFTNCESCRRVGRVKSGVRIKARKSAGACSVGGCNVIPESGHRMCPHHLIKYRTYRYSYDCRKALRTLPTSELEAELKRRRGKERGK